MSVFIYLFLIVLLLVPTQTILIIHFFSAEEVEHFDVCFFYLNGICTTQKSIYALIKVELYIQGKYKYSQNKLRVNDVYLYPAT